MENRIDLLGNCFIELVNSMGDDNTIVSAARVSLLGESKGAEQDKKLIAYLLKNKHTSPFEQVEFQFRVKCPLFVARQWHRHRTWSYNEISRRYTAEEIDFYIPAYFRKQAESNRQASTDEKIFTIEWQNYTTNTENLLKYVTNSAENLYKTLLDNGVAREQARMVLPQNMNTMFYAKTDLHNLLHFIDLRDSEHSQYEIRVYAQAMLKLITPIVPWTIEAWSKLKGEQNV